MGDRLALLRLCQKGTPKFGQLGRKNKKETVSAVSFSFNL